MTDIVDRMEALAAVLPEQNRRGRPTIREVSLVRYGDGSWEVKAGGHPAVSIGEWGGDFAAEGDTAEDAIAACAEKIRSARG